MALTATDARRSATVAALEPAETMAVYYGEFERLRRRHPKIEPGADLVPRGRDPRANELLLDALYVPAERRVLLRLAELADVYADGEGVIALTQEELAQIAGTSRGTVNRVLREQEERGTISLRRGKTKIVDRDSLRGTAPVVFRGARTAPPTPLPPARPGPEPDRPDEARNERLSGEAPLRIDLPGETPAARCRGGSVLRTERSRDRLTFGGTDRRAPRIVGADVEDHRVFDPDAAA